MRHRLTNTHARTYENHGVLRLSLTKFFSLSTKLREMVCTITTTAAAGVVVAVIIVLLDFPFFFF